MGIFLPALYFGQRSRIFKWDIPSTTSLHDSAFLLHIYRVSNLNAYVQPPRIDHICLLKNFTATPRGKTKIYMHIPSCSPASSIKSALIFFTPRIRAHKADKLICLLKQKMVNFGAFMLIFFEFHL